MELHGQRDAGGAPDWSESVFRVRRRAERLLRHDGCLPPETDVEDVIQMACLRLHRMLAKGHRLRPGGESGLERWIDAVIRDCASQLWRWHRGQSQLRIEEILMEQAAGMAFEPPADVAPVAEAIERRISERHRLVLFLRESLGLDFAAIAARLGLGRARKARILYVYSRNLRTRLLRAIHAKPQRDEGSGE